MKTKTVPTTPAFEAAYKAVVEAMRPYADDLGPDGIVALYAKLTGRSMAMLDQRKHTTETAFVLAISNIEQGNREMVETLLGETKGTA